MYVFKPVFSILIVIALSAANAFAKDKRKCSSKELHRQDCRLVAGSYTVRLLKESVVWNDGTWHTVDPMPKHDAVLEWEKIEFQLIGGQPVLQMWLWDKGIGETQVQSLHWLVSDAEKRKLTILAEGIVRKRRPAPSATENAVGGAVAGSASVAKPRYLLDQMEKHSLKAVAGDRLEWQLGDQKKILVPTRKNSSTESTATPPAAHSHAKPIAQPHAKPTTSSPEKSHQGDPKHGI